MAEEKVIGAPLQITKIEETARVLTRLTICQKTGRPKPFALSPRRNHMQKIVIISALTIVEHKP
jgi:hypothetical protein